MKQGCPIHPLHPPRLTDVVQVYPRPHGVVLVDDDLLDVPGLHPEVEFAVQFHPEIRIAEDDAEVVQSCLEQSEKRRSRHLTDAVGTTEWQRRPQSSL